MENKPLVFRRINGRIVPIRSKNGEVKKPKHEKGSAAESIAIATAKGGAAGGAVHVAAGQANKFLTNRIDQYSEKLKSYPRRPAPRPFTKPKPPEFAAFEARAMKEQKRNWGVVEDVAKKIKVKASKQPNDFAKIAAKEDAVRRYTRAMKQHSKKVDALADAFQKKVAEHSVYNFNRRAIREPRLQAMVFRKKLNRYTLPAVAVSAAGVAAYSLGASLYDYLRGKRK